MKTAHCAQFKNCYFYIKDISITFNFLQMAATKVPEVRDITRIERIGKNPYFSSLYKCKSVSVKSVLL